MDFVNREQELGFLKRHFSSNQAELLVIWGRRRVGKTFLLQHFARGLPVIYHMGVRTTPLESLRRISRSLATFFDDPLLRRQPLESWENVFIYLEGKKRKFGLVLDEFPYLVESSPSLPSVLQVSWDTALKDSKIKLILCGSSIAMMERALFSASAPLYGRRTGQWLLKPFDPINLRKLIGGSLVECIQASCISGGVPMYAEKLKPPSDLLHHIKDHLLTKGEILYEEVPFLLRQELREPRVYQAILGAISGGASKYSELSSKTGLDRTNLPTYLHTLADLGIVRREVPIMEAVPQKSRKGIYRIQDDFISFWYRFVYPNLDRLEMGEIDGVFDSEIREELHQYISKRCERVITGLFRRPPLNSLVPFQVSFSGRQWSRTEEFDVVLLDAERRNAFIGEIKWSKKPISARLINDLRTRVTRSKIFEGVNRTFALISRAGFIDDHQPSSDEVLVDLAQF